MMAQTKRQMESSYPIPAWLLDAKRMGMAIEDESERLEIQARRSKKPGMETAEQNDRHS